MCRKSDESPETFQIDDDFPDPVGPDVVSEYLKNKEFEIPLSEALENEIYPDDLVPENAVEENEPEKVEDDIKIDLQNYLIPKEFNENGLATEEELSYIYEKARLATLFLLEFNRNKRSKHSVLLPNIGPDERLPILLDLAWLDHWYLDCEFYGSLRVYNVKKNFVIFGVIIHLNYIYSSPKTIWQSKSYYEFANKVIANGGFVPIDTDKVSVFLENGEIKHYVKTNSGWMESSRCIVIDINFRQSTFHYSYSKDGVKNIFEPRYDFKISKIQFGTGKLLSTPYVDLWEAKNKSEYAKKVECISVTVHDPTYIVILIYISDENFFKLVNRGGKWSAVDPKKVCSIKLALWCDCESFSYHVFENDVFRVFEAKEGYDFCALVKRGKHTHFKELVWESHNMNELAYKVIIDGVGHIKNTNNVIIYHINGKCTHLEKIDKNWIVLKPSWILDVSERKPTLGYNYIKDSDQIEYFIPLGMCLFKEVITKEGLVSKFVVNIWKAKNLYEYAYKAIVIRMHRNERYLVLLLVNKSMLLFHRLDKGHQWMQRSVDKGTLHELRMMKVDLTDPRASYKRTKDKINDKFVEYVPSETGSVAQPLPEVVVSKTQIQPDVLVPKPQTPVPQPQVQGFKPISVIQHGNIIDLDITKVYGIRGYDIFYRDDKLIFEARKNYLFKSVTKNEEILWKPKNNADLPNRVLYKRVNNTDKIKVYFPDKIKEDPPNPKPKLSFDPSTIQVEVTKCKKPGSELFKETVVEVSDTPVTTTLEDPEDLYVAPKQAPKKQWVIDDD
ncbi:hypothetical protein MACK_001109 [Theileria orientalis]|uniref:Uncharacterized protein n=1 Tax=Theileria orientalis TaxID=68886 RepID=A0A976QV34_THEOR|nr:hypothetical protein MACK_001109 [Theileria orientalis]